MSKRRRHSRCINTVRNVAYISPVSVLFGAEHSLLESMRTLDRNHYHPLLVTFEEGTLEEAARKEGISVNRLTWLDQLQKQGRCRRILLTWRFAKWLRASRVRIVVLNLFFAWLSIDLGVLILASRLAGAKFILRHRISEHWWLSFYDKFWLSQADRIISVTRSAIEPWLRPRRSDLWSRIKPGRIRVIPSSRNIAAISRIPRNRTVVRSLGIPDHARIVGMVAGMSARKRHELFLKAAAIVSRSEPTTWFLLVGGSYVGAVAPLSNYERFLRQVANENGLADRVIFTGYRSDALSLMSQFDVLVLPSKQEALGGVLIEAMALGIPIVAAHDGGIPEIVKDEYAGLLVASDNPQDYAAATLRIMGDRNLAHQIGENGKVWAEQFGGTRITKLIEQCYEELIIPFN